MRKYLYALVALALVCSAVVIGAIAPAYACTANCGKNRDDK